MGGAGRSLIFPTLENIITLNRQHIRRTGGTFFGLDNLRNRGSLEWVLEAIRYPLFGIDLYPTLAEKAALLAWIIIADHVFYDGCKRTGISALQIFVELNGFQLDATRNERRDIAVAIARGHTPGGHYSREEFFHWVKSRIRPQAFD
jgi:death-on-curing protein